MQTNLCDSARQRAEAAEAERILRSCVHCGFCNATCPTYQELGDELDGPRGRIYLIKQFLERDEASERTRLHLDRCLSCRNCETTCPSGVEYHKLLDIGRDLLAERLPRGFRQRLLRDGLRLLAPRPGLFGALAGAAGRLRPLLPEAMQGKLPRRVAAPGRRPQPRHARRVLLLEGCVQPALSPNTNAAAARVLDRLGISVTPAAAAGCCGALDFHLDAQERGRQRARRNIDAWWPLLREGAEAIVQTASGCGAFVKDYAYLLRDDPRYADKAREVAAAARDLVEVLRDEPLESLGLRCDQRLAFHCPCTLQHAQRLGGAVEAVLRRLGFHLTEVADGHLCCGSAGTYSLTQPALSRRLRDNRLDALESGAPDVIATANVGCQAHLDGAGRTPVRHWIELLDQALPEESETMHSKPVLGREEVARVLGAAREEAQRQGWAVSIAVVDDGGHPLALERLDGCAPIGAYIATEKARSAALGRRETKRYEDMINGGRSAFLSVPLLQATLEGGVPILVDGQVVGAVGVSGVRAEEDARVARIGAEGL